MPNQDRIDLMTWPRTAALSEALWTADARPITHTLLSGKNVTSPASMVKYYHDPMVGADIVWSWSADLHLPKEPKTVDADVTRTLTSAGNYDLWFTFPDGEPPRASRFWKMAKS